MHALSIAVGLVSLSSFLAPGQATPAQPLHVQDAWGRPVDTRGITLLDWEGQLANPAVKLQIVMPADAVYPCDVYIHGTSSRLHFDRSDSNDRYGIGKQIRIPKAVKSVEFLVAMFPDRDSKNENHELVIQMFGPDRVERTRMRMPVRVIDQDPRSWRYLYPILLDYSYDKTGFFKDPDVQKILRQAANDWAYFIDQGQTDPVPIGAETSTIWNPEGFVGSSYEVTNKVAYTGYLMYISGIKHEENRAGGSPSLVGKPQTQAGKPLPIRRSGSVEFDVTGNWNRLGWLFTDGDDDWWHTGSLRGEQADLYSIAIHEMGHALAFEPTYPAVDKAIAGGGLTSDALKAYLGKTPAIDASYHLVGVTDPVSHYGGYGMEYYGDMKARRWLLTKSHLLCLEAIGYKIRHTRAFDILQVIASAFTWRKDQPVKATIEATGGVPDYYFRVKSGALPAGISLDSFTGEFTGVPTQAGSSSVDVEVDDNDPTTPPQQVKIAITVR